MEDIGMDAPPDYDTPSQHTQLPSGPSSPVIPALALTAAEEKEQQRKRYEAATGVGSGSGSSGLPPAATDRQPTYLSAAEEKQIHHKRYNDAVSRTGAGGGIERTDSPSGGMPWATLSAAEEKELQRKRYEEATGRIGASDAGGSISSRAVSPSPFANGTSSPAPVGDPIPYNAIYGNQPSPGNTGPRDLSDKEAMNRYVDKRSSRIVSNPNSSPNPSLVLHARELPSSMQVGSGSRSSRHLPAGGAGLPVDEKAQMKRYYEALDKVNTAQGGSSSSAPTAAYDKPPPIDSDPAPPKAAGYMSAAEEKEQMKKRFEEATSKVNQAKSPRMDEASGSSTRATMATTTYPSAEDEKEQMRKRYEAATAAVGSPSIPNGSGSVGGHSKQGSASSIPPVKGYMSAAEEKEQMRKRFEDATAAVNRQSSQPVSPQIGSGSGSGSGSSHPAPYMSAAEEKEQMRKRFENATAAVNRQSSQPVSPQIGSGSASGSGSVSSQPPAAYMSAAEEKEQMRKRFDSAQAAVTGQKPPVQSQRTLSTPIDPDAPPPPLPTRPPVEYITLLSPVNESERDRPPWSRNEGIGAIGQGEGSGGR